MPKSRLTDAELVERVHTYGILHPWCTPAECAAALRISLPRVRKAITKLRETEKQSTIARNTYRV